MGNAQPIIVTHHEAAKLAGGGARWEDFARLQQAGKLDYHTASNGKHGVDLRQLKKLPGYSHIPLPPDPVVEEKPEEDEEEVGEFYQAEPRFVPTSAMEARLAKLSPVDRDALLDQWETWNPDLIGKYRPIRKKQRRPDPPPEPPPRQQQPPRWPPGPAPRWQPPPWQAQRPARPQRPVRPGTPVWRQPPAVSAVVVGVVCLLAYGLNYSLTPLYPREPDEHIRDISHGELAPDHLTNPRVIPAPTNRPTETFDMNRSLAEARRAETTPARPTDEPKNFMGAPLDQNSPNYCGVGCTSNAHREVNQAPRTQTHNPAPKACAYSGGCLTTEDFKRVEHPAAAGDMPPGWWNTHKRTEEPAPTRFVSQAPKSDEDAPPSESVRLPDETPPTHFVKPPDDTPPTRFIRQVPASNIETPTDTRQPYAWTPPAKELPFRPKDPPKLSTAYFREFSSPKNKCADERPCFHNVPNPAGDYEY